MSIEKYSQIEQYGQIELAEIPDYAIAALQIEWTANQSHSKMPDNIICTNLVGYQGACKAWGVERQEAVIIDRFTLECIAGGNGWYPFRGFRCGKERQQFRSAIAGMCERIAQQWPEEDKNTYVAFEIPARIVAAMKQYPELPEA